MTSLWNVKPTQSLVETGEKLQEAYSYMLHEGKRHFTVPLHNGLLVRLRIRSKQKEILLAGEWQSFEWGTASHLLTL